MDKHLGRKVVAGMIWPFRIIAQQARFCDASCCDSRDLGITSTSKCIDAFFWEVNIVTRATAKVPPSQQIQLRREIVFLGSRAGQAAARMVV